MSVFHAQNPEFAVWNVCTSFSSLVYLAVEVFLDF